MVLNIKAEADARRLCEYVLDSTLNQLYVIGFMLGEAQPSRRLINMRAVRWQILTLGPTPPWSDSRS
jgi:hypothetical protein